MAQPAAPVAIAIGINWCANKEPTPVEMPEPVVVMATMVEVPKPMVTMVEVTKSMMAMVAPSNRTDRVGRGFAEVGLNGR
jgi:ribosomal protein L13E